MRIDRLTVKNFACFELREFAFHPHFNLLVGENGSGKSSILRALSVGVGSWFSGTEGPREQQGILVDDVRAVPRAYGGDYPTFEKQFPAHVECCGEIEGERLTWSRELQSENGRTTTAGAKAIRELASRFELKVREGSPVQLPLVLYYGSDRLWFEKGHQKSTPKRRLPSRLDGYRDCLNSTIQETDLVDWVADESLAKFQRGDNGPTPLDLVAAAITSCVEGAQSIYYEAQARRLVVRMKDGQAQFLGNLSDGLRIMLTMVGDMARRIIQLNPQLGANALTATRGVVLIDELDLHLHPQWQRRIIHDLKRTFPSIQFIATTHSPQLVGQAAPDEITLLDEQSGQVVHQSFGMDSNWVLKHIMGTSERDPDVATSLSEIESMIAGGRLEDARRALRALYESRNGDDPDSVRLSTRIDRIERLGR